MKWSISFFKTFQNRMARSTAQGRLRRIRAGGEPQVGMLCLPGPLSPDSIFSLFFRSVRPEQVSQSKVRPRLSPLIAKAAFARRQQTAAAFDELPHGGRLPIGQRGQVRQDQHRELRGVALDLIHMHGQVWDSSPNQRLGDSAPRLFDQQISLVPAIKIAVLLLLDDADSRNRFAVDQELLVGAVPAIDRLHDAKSAAILLKGAQMMQPWLDPAGGANEIRTSLRPLASAPNRKGGPPKTSPCSPG